LIEASKDLNMDYELRQRKIQESLEEGTGTRFNDSQNKSKVLKKKYFLN
jgi:hypothetical protein